MFKMITLLFIRDRLINLLKKEEVKGGKGR